MRGVAVEWHRATVGFKIHVRFSPTVGRTASRATSHRETHFFHEDIFCTEPHHAATAILQTILSKQLSDPSRTPSCRHVAPHAIRKAVIRHCKRLARVIHVLVL